MTTGQKIRTLRKEKKLTQKQLGQLSGIDEANIRKYELDRQNPKIETLEKIASALDVPLAVLVENLTWETWQQTDEAAKVEKTAAAMQGIIDFLVDIYGTVEEKTVSNEVGECVYYLVGKGDKQFAIHESVIVALYNITRATIPHIVELSKISESQAIEELTEVLKSMPDDMPEDFK